jgi:hypothetical protein
VSTLPARYSKLNLRIPAPLFKRVAELAVNKNISRSALIVAAIEGHVAIEEPRQRLALVAAQAPHRTPDPPAGAGRPATTFRAGNIAGSDHLKFEARRVAARLTAAGITGYSNK